MTTKPVIKPTRRELLDVAIGEYRKNLRTQQLNTLQKAREFEEEIREIERQKSVRFHAHIRKPYAEQIEALRKAIEPFQGKIYENITNFGASGCSFFTYSASVEFREEIKTGSGPDMSDLEALMVEKRNQASEYNREAEAIGRRASKVDNQDLFKHIAGSLPPEAGELLDKLADMIGDVLNDKEELVVVVYTPKIGTDVTIEERNPCHSRVQAKNLQKKLAEQYGPDYSVEIEKP